jgi:hypothetical protein
VPAVTVSSKHVPIKSFPRRTQSGRRVRSTTSSGSAIFRQGLVFLTLLPARLLSRSFPQARHPRRLLQSIARRRLAAVCRGGGPNNVGRAQKVPLSSLGMSAGKPRLRRAYLARASKRSCPAGAGPSQKPLLTSQRRGALRKHNVEVTAARSAAVSGALCTRMVEAGTSAFLWQCRAGWSAAFCVRRVTPPPPVSFATEAFFPLFLDAHYRVLRRGPAARRFRIRMTCVSYHRPPLGDGTLRSLRVTTAAAAGSAANSSKTGRNRAARSVAARKILCLMCPPEHPVYNVPPACRK